MIQLDVTGLEDLISDMSTFERGLEERVEKASREVAEEIFQESQLRVPVDTGKLKRSGRIVQSGNQFFVEYTADYAVHVEYRTELSHDNGQARFLHDSIQIVLDHADKIIARHVESFIEDSFQ